MTAMRRYKLLKAPRHWFSISKFSNSRSRSGEWSVNDTVDVGGVLSQFEIAVAWVRVDEGNRRFMSAVYWEGIIVNIKVHILGVARTY
jgi:hypothetical protein